jgi:LysR family nod box-dependent transcriptional activator
VALGDVDLNLLVTLDALLAERNVTRAGARLGLSQPTTSAALAKLRRVFDDPLLVRVGRDFQLSPRAELLVPQVREILELAERAVRDRPDFDPGSDAREFTISSSDYAAIVLLRPVIERISTSGPRLGIHLLPRNADAPGLLQRGEVDLVVEPTETMRADGLRSTLLFDDRWRCAVWTDSVGDDAGPAMTDGEFERRPYLTYTLGPSHIPNLADQHLMRLGRARTATVTTENFALVPFLLRGTELVSLVLERGVTVFDSAPRVRLVDPPFDLPLLTEAMYWNPRVDADPAHRWLRQQVADAAAELEPTAPPT